MNLFKKSIFISLIFTVSIIGMDGENASSSEHLKIQAEQEARPTKEKITQAIIQTQIMPDVLAPLIAAYAENPLKGYMFIVPKKGFKISQCPPGGLEYIQQKWPQFTKDLTKDSIMVEVWVSSEQSILDGYNPRPWHAGYFPTSNHKIQFPLRFPAKILKNLKEDDSLFITIYGIPLELKCSQLTHRYRYDHENRLHPFEKAFAQATQGLLEPSKESIDEDQQ